MKEIFIFTLAYVFAYLLIRLALEFMPMPDIYLMLFTYLLACSFLKKEDVKLEVKKEIEDYFKNI